MPLFAQHRLAAAIVAAALAATAGAFLFARPEYRQPSQGEKLVFPEAKPPVEGWTWADGTPGFQFGQDHDRWNISNLRPAELAAARAAAHDAGVDPASLGVLQVSRTQPHGRPQALVAGAGPAGRTCIGAQLERGPVSFLCAPQLDDDLGLVLADASPPQAGIHSMFLTGVVRADVTRVTVTTSGMTYVDHTGAKPIVRPFGAQTVYTRRSEGWWGTFVDTTAQPGSWHAQVVFYGDRGPLGSLDVRFTRAGERLAVAHE